MAVQDKDVLTKEELDAFLRSTHLTWRYAKSMPQNPHEYLRFWDGLKNGEYTEEQFNAVVMAIRSLGNPRHFFKATYIYYDLDGFTYWTMGAPIDETIILNKARRQSNAFPRPSTS